MRNISVGNTMILETDATVFDEIYKSANLSGDHGLWVMRLHEGGRPRSPEGRLLRPSEALREKKKHTQFLRSVGIKPRVLRKVFYCMGCCCWARKKNKLRHRKTCEVRLEARHRSVHP
jgi:hypothetical protein